MPEHVHLRYVYLTAFSLIQAVSFSKDRSGWFDALLSYDPSVSGLGRGFCAVAGTPE